MFNELITLGASSRMNEKTVNIVVELDLTIVQTIQISVMKLSNYLNLGNHICTADHDIAWLYMFIVISYHCVFKLSHYCCVCHTCLYLIQNKIFMIIGIPTLTSAVCSCYYYYEIFKKWLTYLAIGEILFQWLYFSGINTCVFFTTFCMELTVSQYQISMKLEILYQLHTEALLVSLIYVMFDIVI